MQKMKNLWSNHPWLPVVIGIVGTLGGGIIWILVSEAQNFTSDYEAMLDREVAEVHSATQRVQTSLARLAMVADGRRRASGEMVIEFDRSIANLHERTRSLSGLLPKTKEEFSRYKESMLALSDSVGKLIGPGTAREFVEGSASWYYAGQNFDKKVEAARTAMPWRLLRVL